MTSPREGAILLAAGTAAHRDLLAQKLIFHKSDLNKSTTICKVGDLEVFPKAFLDSEKYTSMRCTPVRYTPMSCTPISYTPMRCTPVRYTPHEVYAHEVHAYELHAHKVHAREVHAHEMHVL